MDDAFNRQLSKVEVGTRAIGSPEEAKEISLRDAGEELGTGVIGDAEIIVHWVNKYGVPMDIKTRRGGLIHALWQAEHEKRSRSGWKNRWSSLR